jgi:hypothetical protein
MFLLVAFSEMPSSFSQRKNSAQRYKKTYCRAGVITAFNSNRLFSVFTGDEKEGVRGRKNKKTKSADF